VALAFRIRRPHLMKTKNNEIWAQATHAAVMKAFW
jgi:hypothetical protein